MAPGRKKLPTHTPAFLQAPFQFLVGDGDRWARTTLGKPKGDSSDKAEWFPSQVASSGSPLKLRLSSLNYDARHVVTTQKGFP